MLMTRDFSSIGSPRLLMALLASALLHAAVILGLGFKAPELLKTPNDKGALELVLVNSKHARAPNKADALAQANLDGGGNTDEERHAKTPLPYEQQADQGSELDQKKAAVRQLDQQAQQLLSQIKTSTPVPVESPRPTPSRDGTVPDGADLVRRSLELARLEGQIAKEWDTYQKRPKRQFVGARTSEYAFARYVEDWRAKVERVGNLNYPQAARDQKLYGSLKLTVSIRADGSLEGVTIDRSSGYKVLDDAAVNIVRLAAPYSAFPDDMRSKVDILGITRTWTFTRADQWASGD